jgi:1,4-dihydroxy-2-naphthoate octaprenyltransferase
MTKRQAWIKAIRLRTLPLAVAGILMGGFLAAADKGFRWDVTLLAILTATFLQILSNLANDYGDSVHGADSAERVGPSRAVQSGLITLAEMRRAMFVSAALAMVSGVLLIILAFGWQQLLLVAIFIALGGAAIWAAINYTAGSNPYGYVGLGDFFVFVFFGLVAVLGTFYLNTGDFQSNVILPAASVGLFAVAVLNINNIRDINSDKLAGKISLAVRWGLENAQRYHVLLIAFGLLFAGVYVAQNFESVWQLLFLIAVPLFIKNARAVISTPSEKLNPLLGQMAMTTLLFVLSFGIGQLLANLL